MFKIILCHIAIVCIIIMNGCSALGPINFDADIKNAIVKGIEKTKKQYIVDRTNKEIKESKIEKNE